MNLERRSKWHYLLNEGFVPILEVPSGHTILESRIIMDYLELAYSKEGVKLYSGNPEERAQ
jgi:glutathione S-transferase